MKIIRKIYRGIFIAFFLLFTALLFFYRLDVKPGQDNDNADGTFGEITDYTVKTSNSLLSPVNLCETYMIPLGEIGDNPTALFFYTIHQETEVYVEDVCIYSQSLNNNRLFGKSPGNVWNSLMLSDEYSGKMLEIKVYPSYQSSVGVAPRFYMGDRYSIVNSITRKDALALLLGIIAVITGLTFVVYVKYNEDNSEVNRKLSMLGAFSMAMGVWKISDTSTCKLFFQEEPAISMVPFIALMLSVVPAVLFIKELFRNKDHIIWYILCWVALAQSLIVIAIQFTDTLDLRQSFISTVFIMALCAVAFIGMMVYEFVRFGWNGRQSFGIIGIVGCVAGIFFDLVYYYLSHGTRTTVFGMTVFLVYVLIQGGMEIKMARELTILGRKSQNFEKMAYHDQMTGLFNRTAFAEDTDRLTFDPSRAILMVFDLNNLKKCNDVLGHERGDSYIRESAELIQSVFGELGKCYRTGGDEFCCLVLEQGLDICKQKIEVMHQKVNAYNRKSKDIRMGIACGYALYDKRIDYDINDTAKRADKMMYSDKEELKKKEEIRNKRLAKKDE